jgi:hypothetical protein
VLRVLPEKDSPEPKTTDWRFLLASDITREEVVRVATLTLPVGRTWKMEEPVEELMLSKAEREPVAVPWTVSSPPGVEVLIPTLPPPRNKAA